MYKRQPCTHICTYISLHAPTHAYTHHIHTHTRTYTKRHTHMYTNIFYKLPNMDNLSQCISEYILCKTFPQQVRFRKFAQRRRQGVNKAAIYYCVSPKGPDSCIWSHFEYTSFPSFLQTPAHNFLGWEKLAFRNHTPRIMFHQIAGQRVARQVDTSKSHRAAEVDLFYSHFWVLFYCILAE